MSHFSKIATEITDEEALKAGVNRLGFELVPNGQCRYYYGRERVDLLVCLPGKYDLGLMRESGHLSIKADFYKGYVEKYLGAGAGLLMQSYAVEKTKMEAYKRSLAVTEARDGEDIILTLMDTDTGGQIIVTCPPGGKINVKTQGFPGQSCMKFQDLEKALGAQEEFQATMEMYEAEPICGTEYLRNITDL